MLLCTTKKVSSMKEGGCLEISPFLIHYFTSCKIGDTVSLFKWLEKRMLPLEVIR